MRLTIDQFAVQFKMTGVDALAAFYTSGPEPCFVLDSMKPSFAASTSMTLFEGHAPGDVPCRLPPSARRPS